MKNTLARAIRTIAGTENMDPTTFAFANVVSVDIKARTCVVETISDKQPVEIQDVLLMASVGDGSLKIPAVDSTVIIAYTNQVTPFVFMYSDLDDIIMTVGKSQISMKSGLTVFNDGSYGGLIKIVELVERLNNLEKDNNNLKQLFGSWTVSPNDGGAALRTVVTGIAAGPPLPTSWAGKSLTETDRKDIENETVTHGNTSN